MTAPAVYIIWYGTWTTSAKSIIQNFVTNLGATPFWAINKAYGAGAITFKQGIDDAAYSQGKNLTNSMTVWSVVQNALNKALLPKDTNGIYLVLSSSDVAQPGFCTQFCGWHSYYGSYKFSWVGIPASGCNCFAQYTSPNGNAAVDSAVSVIAHELMETATDPMINAWYNSDGDENGDACAWNFVNSIYSSGYYYNLVVNGKKYYVQANYNLGSQTCTMS